MRAKYAARWATLALGVGLAIPSAVAAGSPCQPGPCDGADCPRSSYSPLHYWTPTLYRWKAWHHCPGQYLYAPNFHPDMPPTYQFFRYPCRAVAPAAYYGGPPSNPGTVSTESSSTDSASSPR